MKINWNWGTGILIAIIAFMSFIVILVYFTMNQNYDLVEKDYYPKALEYQQQIDKEQNSKLLEEAIQVDNQGDFILLTFQQLFKSEQVSGELVFYRPSDKKDDIRIAISLDSTNAQRIPANILQAGRYILKIDYTVNGKAYFQEEPLFID